MTPDKLEAEIRSLIVAQPTNLGIEVELPLVYPNGDGVRVIVSRDKDAFLVHDAGFGAMNFSSFGGKFTKAAIQRLSTLAEKYGCEFKYDRISRRCTEDQLAVACVVVANASRTIGDQVLEMRRYVENEFREVLTDLLKNIIGRRLRSHEQVFGASGRSYRIPHLILDEKEQDPVAYIMPVANRNAISLSFAELFDIKKASPSILNNVVYDDHADIRDEDRNLLSEASDKIIPFFEASKYFSGFSYAH